MEDLEPMRQLIPRCRYEIYFDVWLNNIPRYAMRSFPFSSSIHVYHCKQGHYTCVNCATRIQIQNQGFNDFENKKNMCLELSQV